MSDTECWFCHGDFGTWERLRKHLKSHRELEDWTVPLLTLDSYKRLRRLFWIEYEKADGHCKPGEPSVSISYMIQNDDNITGKWLCHIHSYLVEIRDSTGQSGRGYDYEANSLKELAEIIDKAITEAEDSKWDVPMEESE